MHTKFNNAQELLDFLVEQKVQGVSLTELKVMLHYQEYSDDAGWVTEEANADEVSIAGRELIIS